ncbi:hypothetical protein SHKM778_38610 [Streptomyces sp. KM77-8]|uniref:FAD-binding domain-containing protein n=1 Tax=Streptomyces haneummycinicus TaxID=3074435 RepID=A0AAT9HJN9_9ACTN
MPVRTRVAVVGAGPAGLLLSHLLGRHGIESVVVDSRSRAEIETTIRAGILEQGTVEILSGSGASDRVLTAGHRHEGIELRFGGEGHRIDFTGSVGRAVWLYPQHEVLKDLIAARLRAGQDLRFGVSAERVEGAETDRPRVLARDAGAPPSRSRPMSSSARTAPAAWSARRSRARTAAPSGSTRSPGSASCARRRPAPRS